MFTDINSAIDEARFMKATTGHCHAVIQRPGGIMHVRKVWRRGIQTLYTTKQDRFGTVNTDEQGAA
ncbi:Uncharacterised protein [Yersinia kristensenii]|nr:Uncharacterised protein [Yersinia kristensenii]CNJ68308.1 Uncharacterised protein [Yersinia kristensenii]